GSARDRAKLLTQQEICTRPTGCAKVSSGLGAKSPLGRSNLARCRLRDRPAFCRGAKKGAQYRRAGRFNQPCFLSLRGPPARAQTGTTCDQICMLAVLVRPLNTKATGERVSHPRPG